LVPRLSDHSQHREGVGHPAAQNNKVSEQQGDGEAHQGQPSQTGGGQNRYGLGHGQIQQGQNLEQSLRSAIIPAWNRSNPSWQRGPASVEQFCGEQAVQLSVLPSPAFLESVAESQAWFEGRRHPS